MNLLQRGVFLKIESNLRILSEKISVRGSIVSSLVLLENFGILIAFILGHFCDFHTTPMIVIVLIAVCTILLYFFPETPTFLVKQNKISVSTYGLIINKNLNSILCYRRPKSQLHSIMICVAKIKIPNSSKWK